MILKNTKIILEGSTIPQGWIGIQDNIIKQIEERDAPNFSGTVIDLQDLKVLPGFIDVHTHGGYGVAFETGTIEAFNTYAHNILKEGVTRFCQATVTLAVPVVSKLMHLYHDWIINHNHGLQAKQIGIHIEGPFISAEKKGAHPLELLMQPNPDVLHEWIIDSGHNIKMVTFAPELAGDSFYQLINDENITASAGHSNISAEKFLEHSINHNVHHVTHLFNGMSGVHQHTPGLAVGALLNDSVLCEVIADGHHILPVVLELIYKIKGYKGICLISDSMMAKGLPDGEYMLGELQTVSKDGVSTIKGSTMIAGSVAKYDHCYRTFKNINRVDDEYMVYMSSINAARQLGIYNKTGSIAVNKLADLVILDHKDQVVMTIVEGRVVYINKKYQHRFNIKLLNKGE